MSLKPDIKQHEALEPASRMDSAGLTRTAEFERLLRTHDGALRGMADRLVGDDVDDVLQVAYLKAFEQRSSFRGDSSPRTWLYTHRLPNFP